MDKTQYKSRWRPSRAIARPTRGARLPSHGNLEEDSQDLEAELSILVVVGGGCRGARGVINFASSNLEEDLFGRKYVHNLQQIA